MFPLKTKALIQKHTHYTLKHTFDNICHIKKARLKCWGKKDSFIQTFKLCLEKKLTNKHSKYTTMHSKAARMFSEHRTHKKTQKVSSSYSRQKKKRKKIVSHVGVALSNIPSLLCWLLLLRWGTFAIPRLLHKTPKIHSRLEGKRVSRVLTY